MQKCRKNVCGGQKFNRHPETKINYQAQTPRHPQVEAAAAAPEVRRESLFKLLLLYIISFLIALFACISRYIDNLISFTGGCAGVGALDGQ